MTNILKAKVLNVLDHTYQYVSIYCFLVVFVLFAYGCKSEPDQPNTNKSTSNLDVAVLESEAMKKYQEAPINAIPIFKKVAAIHERESNVIKAGITNLNIANIYDEHLNQIDSALSYANKSLKIWKGKNDSMQMANLLKYIGLLQGKKSDYDDAIRSITSALSLYEELDFPQGRAVSKFNLANVYFEMKDYPRSLEHLTSAKSFWNTKSDYGRIYSNNILAIKIYHKMNDPKNVHLLIKENIQIEKDGDIHKFNKKQFHDVLTELKLN